MKICMGMMVLGALFLFLYAFGKIIWLIHSPIWVDMSPYITVASTVAAICISTGMILQKIANMDMRLCAMEMESKGHTKQFSKVLERLAVIETKLSLR